MQDILDMIESMDKEEEMEKKTEEMKEEKADLVEEKKVATEDAEDVIEEIEVTIEKEPAPSTVQADKKIKSDKFDLAKVLGKTESGMKAEFYVYQIKELMQKVGKAFDTKQVSVPEIHESYAEISKLGACEMLVSPIYASECAKAEKKNPSGAKFGAIIDYPFGESSFKAKMVELKNCIKSGFDSITVTFPTSAAYLNKLNSERSVVVKLAKKCKVPFGVAINSDMPMEDVRKLLKAIANSKISFITLLLDKLDNVSILDYFEEISVYKGKLKVYAYTSIRNVKDLAKLIEYSADRVYTPYVEDIGQELLTKFGVEI